MWKKKRRNTIHRKPETLPSVSDHIFGWGTWKEQKQESSKKGSSYHCPHFFNSAKIYKLITKSTFPAFMPVGVHNARIAYNDLQTRWRRGRNCSRCNIETQIFCFLVKPIWKEKRDNSLMHRQVELMIINCHESRSPGGDSGCQHMATPNTGYPV